MIITDMERFTHVRIQAIDHLLALRRPEGYWEGCLSASALSTATAVSALSLAGLSDDESHIRAGVDWLTCTQNADGGWGDTIDSPSNLATTMLGLSALQLSALPATEVIARARQHLADTVGNTPTALLTAIQHCYGNDRTFAVPILINCALAGLLPWKEIPELPFELAVVPSSWYKTLRLHVVSYAMPALIAIGLLLHEKHPTRHQLKRHFRSKVITAALSRLTKLQPSHGGFLDAAPLTAFVAMSLLASSHREHPVAGNCLNFLRNSQRGDGSWPIDSNLSVWITSNAVSALAQHGAMYGELPSSTRIWMLSQQYQRIHRYTNAAPGGWGWTHLPGGVPDADDTAGAILALQALGEESGIMAGVAWLLGMQNADGGWPTFCRGWGHLPFDKSSPDITAHALRALHAVAATSSRRRIRHAIANGYRYLKNKQRPDGSWVPLWFGNQAAVHQQNPVFGTARVLLSYQDQPQCPEALAGIQFLLASQNTDGGWGGDARTPTSTEETAVVISGLCTFRQHPGVEEALACALDQLVARIEDGRWKKPTPIGLYFASLWYAETHYPILWTVEALGRVARQCPETGIFHSRAMKFQS